MKKLRRSFYDRDTVLVAHELLGKHLVHRVAGVERIGRIVEVEAYLGPHDLAAHSARGLTPRTRVMFGPPGHAYVYMIYGMHHGMNVVVDRDGVASAVLIRGLEPVSGVEGTTDGPGKLCRTLSIDRTLNGEDLVTGKKLWVASDDAPPSNYVTSSRIGIEYAGPEWVAKPWRFSVAGSPFVSRPRP